MPYRSFVKRLIEFEQSADRIVKTGLKCNHKLNELKNSPKLLIRDTN